MKEDTIFNLAFRVYVDYVVQQQIENNQSKTNCIEERFNILDELKNEEIPPLKLIGQLSPKAQQLEKVSSALKLAQSQDDGIRLASFSKSALHFSGVLFILMLQVLAMQLTKKRGETKRRLTKIWFIVFCSQM